MRKGGLLIALAAAFATPAAAHTGGTAWPAGKAMRAIDDVRVRVGSRIVRIDAATALCSGEGRGVMRRGLRTWLHFRCTFTTFGATGPGRDVEFRLHALDARRFRITDAHWIGR